MGLRRILALCTVLAAVLGYSASVAAPAIAATSTTATGWVRCANLSPGNSAVDIYLLAFGNSANPTVLKHVTYGGVSTYMAVPSGEYTVAMRAVGASASSPPIVSTNFMVSGGTNYTVASLGPAAARRLEVLKDAMAAPKGQVLVRVIQASLKQDQVTITVGGNVLAQQLAFGAVTSYMSVAPGPQNVQFSASGQQTSMSETFAAGSVHTIVVLDSSSGLKIDILTDAVPAARTTRWAALPLASAGWLRPLRPERRRGWPPWPPGCC